jgi:hypothetical protein
MVKANPLVSRLYEEGLDLISLNSICPEYPRDYWLVRISKSSVNV